MDGIAAKLATQNLFKTGVKESTYAPFPDKETSSFAVPSDTTFIQDVLHQLKQLRQSTTNDSQEKILEEASLNGIRKYIESGKCKNIIVMAGAGISTSAGIRDYRSPGTGLYHVIPKLFDLSNPQQIFELEYFRENPKPFFQLTKEVYKSVEPTPTHYFLKLLQDKGLLLRHFTQNVDGLERLVGLDKDKLIEAHGCFKESHCLGCKTEYSFEWMTEKILGDEIPRCTKCQDIIKPNIIFYGEDPAPRYFQCVEEDFSKCDLLIIMGTSLLVESFASLVNKVPSKCPRLLINREKVGLYDESAFLERLRDHFVSQVDFDYWGPILASLLCPDMLNFESLQQRDVALIGDCDDGVMQFAKILGWDTDLLKLMEAKNGLNSIN